MAESKKVVVIAIDATKQSKKALDFYLTNLHTPEDIIVLTHVVDMPDISQQTWLSSHAMSERWKEQDGKADKLEKRYGKYLLARGVTDVNFRIDSGQKPGKVICDVANEEKACMLILGTRGLSTLHRTLMGSVSDYVLHHAPCPVVICKQTEEESKAGKRGSISSGLSELSVTSVGKRRHSHFT